METGVWFGTDSVAAMIAAWRVPFVFGSAGRLAYGLCAMLVPEWMEGRFAPTLRKHPDPRMNLRGFGGAQSAIAIYTLAHATTPERARGVLFLNALVDGFDAGVSALEWQARGELDRVAGGGVALNLVALAFWIWAAAALRVPPDPNLA